MASFDDSPVGLDILLQVAQEMEAMLQKEMEAQLQKEMDIQFHKSTK